MCRYLCRLDLKSKNVNAISNTQVHVAFFEKNERHEICCEASISNFAKVLHPMQMLNEFAQEFIKILQRAAINVRVTRRFVDKGKYVLSLAFYGICLHSPYTSPG